MFLFKKLWVALTFIVSIAAFPWKSVEQASLLVTEPSARYVMISDIEKQAQIYAKAGHTLVWDSTQNTEQLGRGVYMTPGIAEWPGSPAHWDCAILADSSTWDPVNKMWLPEADGCKPLWFLAGAPNRPAYLVGLGLKSSNTVMLSRIPGVKTLQLLIPPELLDGQTIVTQCAAKTDAAGIASISAYGRADWYSWPEVIGTAQTVQEGRD